MEDFGLDLKHEEILDDMVNPFFAWCCCLYILLSVGSYENSEKEIHSTFLLMIHLQKHARQNLSMR